MEKHAAGFWQRPAAQLRKRRGSGKQRLSGPRTSVAAAAWLALRLSAAAVLLAAALAYSATWRKPLEHHLGVLWQEAQKTSPPAGSTSLAAGVPQEDAVRAEGGAAEGRGGSSWCPSAQPRDPQWPGPQRPSSGYLLVRCNGGLNQQRAAICNAVVAARILNATLVLPELDTNDYWHDTGGFAGMYDVDHFIASLEGDVDVVRGLPPEGTSGKRRKPLQVNHGGLPRPRSSAACLSKTFTCFAKHKP